MKIDGKLQRQWLYITQIYIHQRNSIFVTCIYNGSFTKEIGKSNLFPIEDMCDVIANLESICSNNMQKEEIRRYM